MNTVQDFYANPQREWERFTRHPMEYALTLRIFADYLPPLPATILDIGGGPGRYAIALAQKGYQVTLIDLTPEHIEFARAQANEMNVMLDTQQGDARTLSHIANESYDAVLVMGPLYHLPEEVDRRQCLQEASRILRPGGMIFTAHISRMAYLLYCIREHGVAQALTEREVIQSLIRTGSHPSMLFPQMYCAGPDEIQTMLTSEGFTMHALYATEGITPLIESQINALSSDQFDQWVDLNYQIASQPWNLGASEHFLAVGEKP
jgi:S-adenosylmethionine-dependent methyltransferase